MHDLQTIANMHYILLWNAPENWLKHNENIMVVEQRLMQWFGACTVYILYTLDPIVFGGTPESFLGTCLTERSLKDLY